MTLDIETLVDLYRDMWLIRAFEFGLEREFKKGNVPGMLHTGVGQEATQAALAVHLQASDAFFPDHRCHGINALAQEKHQGDGERIMAELFGRATGVCSGKGGSLHSANPKVGNFGDNAVEGSYMATVLGVALAYQMRGQPSVACCIIGDGTVGRGEFHESLNMAAIWKLPVLYACVNNGYAISTNAKDQYRSDGIAPRGPAFGLPTIRIDGNDLLAVVAATKKARDICLNEGRPCLIEAMTYRIGAHSTSDDDTKYRTRDAPIEVWGPR